MRFIHIFHTLIISSIFICILFITSCASRQSNTNNTTITQIDRYYIEYINYAYAQSDKVSYVLLNNLLKYSIHAQQFTIAKSIQKELAIITQRANTAIPNTIIQDFFINTLALYSAMPNSSQRDIQTVFSASYLFSINQKILTTQITMWLALLDFTIQYDLIEQTQQVMNHIYIIQNPIIQLTTFEKVNNLLKNKPLYSNIQESIIQFSLLILSNFKDSNSNTVEILHAYALTARIIQSSGIFIQSTFDLVRQQFITESINLLTIWFQNEHTHNNKHSADYIQTIIYTLTIITQYQPEPNPINALLYSHAYIIPLLVGMFEAYIAILRYDTAYETIASIQELINTTNNPPNDTILLFIDIIYTLEKHDGTNQMVQKYDAYLSNFIQSITIQELEENTRVALFHFNMRPHLFKQNQNQDIIFTTNNEQAAMQYMRAIDNIYTRSNAIITALLRFNNSDNLYYSCPTDINQKQQDIISQVMTQLQADIKQNSIIEYIYSYNILYLLRTYATQQHAAFLEKIQKQNKSYALLLQILTESNDNC